MEKESTVNDGLENDCLEKDLFYEKIKLFYYVIILSG